MNAQLAAGYSPSRHSPDVCCAAAWLIACGNKEAADRLHKKRGVPNAGHFFFMPEMPEKQGLKKIVILPIAQDAEEGYNKNADLRYSL